MNFYELLNCDPSSEAAQIDTEFKVYKSKRRTTVMIFFSSKQKISIQIKAEIMKNLKNSSLQERFLFILSREIYTIYG